MPACANKRFSYSTASQGSCHAHGTLCLNLSHLSLSQPFYQRKAYISSKWITPTDNMQPKSDNTKQHHRYLRLTSDVGDGRVGACPEVAVERGLPPYRMPWMFRSVCQSCPRDHSASRPSLTSAQSFHAVEKQQARQTEHQTHILLP